MGRRSRSIVFYCPLPARGTVMSDNSEPNQWHLLALAAIVIALIFVADANWPAHMGPQGVLLDHVRTMVGL